MLCFCGSWCPFNPEDQNFEGFEENPDESNGRISFPPPGNPIPGREKQRRTEGEETEGCSLCWTIVRENYVTLCGVVFVNVFKAVKVVVCCCFVICCLCPSWQRTWRCYKGVWMLGIMLWNF